jgi:hypothetical protein
LLFRCRHCKFQIWPISVRYSRQSAT